MKITSAVLKPWQLGAAELSDDPPRSTKLIASARAWLAESGDRLGDLREDLATLTRLASAWRRGTYKKTPKATIIKVLLAVGYVVSPVDLIPDFIPVVGYLDDIAVLKWVLSSISGDIEDFRVWERSKKVRRAKRRKGAAKKKKK